jgi:hypothetical protein
MMRRDAPCRQAKARTRRVALQVIPACASDMSVVKGNMTKYTVPPPAFSMSTRVGACLSDGRTGKSRDAHGKKLTTAI